MDKKRLDIGKETRYITGGGGGGLQPKKNRTLPRISNLGFIFRFFSVFSVFPFWPILTGLTGSC